MSLELAPRFNNKIELDNTYKGYSPEVIEEQKRVARDMQILDSQVIAAAKAMEIMAQPETEPKRKLSRKEIKEGLDKIMEGINTQ